MTDGNVERHAVLAEGPVDGREDWRRRIHALMDAAADRGFCGGGPPQIYAAQYHDDQKDDRQQLGNGFQPIAPSIAQISTRRQVRIKKTPQRNKTTKANR